MTDSRELDWNLIYGTGGHSLFNFQVKTFSRRKAMMNGRRARVKVNTGDGLCRFSIMGASKPIPSHAERVN